VKNLTRTVVMCVATLGASLMLMGGCATLDAHDGSAKLIVTYATLKVIEQGDTPQAQIERAQKIHQIAADAKTFLAGESVTLGLLQTAIRDQIAPLNLSPADSYLADALVQVVIDELQHRVGTGVLLPDQLYQASTVLGWVIDATAYAG